MDNVLDMSDDENFIILLLDAVDGQAFSEVIEKNPEYKEIFNDFTFYNNTIMNVQVILIRKNQLLEIKGIIM